MRYFLLLFLILSQSEAIAAPTSTKSINTSLDKSNFRKAPTTITSDSLTVENEKKIFVYKGGVKVVQADMTLLCDVLEGRYNDKNQIETLTALKNVHITKGDSIKAAAQKGVYTAVNSTIVLTENPSLEQNGNTLAADVIKIYLDENRSEAQGKVSVNLSAKAEEGKAQTPVISPTAVPSTPTPIPGIVILGQGKK